MKRKLWILLFAGICLFAAGCGETSGNDGQSAQTSENEASTGGTLLDLMENPEAYLNSNTGSGLLEIGQYKGLTVEAAKYVPSEDEIDYYIQSFFAEEASDFEWNKAVENGDTVVIDFVGKIDGEAFEGGTADDYTLVIGSHSFIDGFEDGVIGMEVGDVKDLELSFPENYHNAELAGKPCVFTVTLDKVIPSLSDDAVATLQNPDYSNVEEYKAFQSEVINDYFNSDYETTAMSGLLDQIINTSKFGILPEDSMNEQRQRIISAYTDVASSYGLDVDTYLSYNGTDVETLAGLFVKRDLVFLSIAEAEGITISDTELDEIAERYIFDYATVEMTLDEFYEQEGGRDAFMKASVIEKVYRFLLDNSNIVEPSSGN